MAGHNPGNYKSSQDDYATQSYAEYQESTKKNRVFASDNKVEKNSQKNSGKTKLFAIGTMVVVVAGAVGFSLADTTEVEDSLNDEISDFMDDNSERFESLNVSHDRNGALIYAEERLETQHFSESELLEDLTSEYGEVYSQNAAEYAVENVDVDWNEEALEAAESYVEHSHFSYDGLHHQLTAESADNYTDEQARYAVDNVDADWYAEAVEAAEAYWNLDTIEMDAERLRNLLTDDNVGRYTDDQVDRAMEELGIS